MDCSSCPKGEIFLAQRRDNVSQRLQGTDDLVVQDSFQDQEDDERG